MPDHVKITKNGLIRVDWDGDKRINVESVPDDPWVCLRSECRIDEDVTLGDIFRMMEGDELLTEFIRSYSWCGPIHEFHKAAKLPRKPPAEPPQDDPDYEPDPLLYLEICFDGETFTFEGVTDYNDSPDFYGVGSKEPRYSVSCTPMSELVHLPVRINTDFTIRANFVDEVVKAKRVMSLLEVLDAIYWDISFHGGPEENSAFVDELKGMVDELKGMMDDIKEREARGEVGIPFEEVMKELRDGIDAQKLIKTNDDEPGKKS